MAENRPAPRYTWRFVLRLLAVFLEAVFLLGTTASQFPVPMLPAWQAAALLSFMASFL